MAAACNIAPTGLQVGETPLLFLAPEIWGEPVAERERRQGLGNIRWAQLDGEGGPRPSPGPRISMFGDEPEDLVWLSPCSELAPPPSGELLPYPHDEQRRWSWADAGLLAAVTAAATFGITLTCFAVLGVPFDGNSSAAQPKGGRAVAALLPVFEPAPFTMVYSGSEDDGSPMEPAALTSGTTGQGASEPSPSPSVDEGAERAAVAAEPRPRRRARPVTRRASRRAAATELARESEAVEVVYETSPQRPVARPRVERPRAPAGMLFRRDELMPRSLTSARVRIGLRSVAPLLRNCSPDGPRQAPVTLTISGDSGRVSAVRVGGPLGGTPEGDCVERALSRARFPRFAEPTHQLSGYPIVLR